MSAIEQIVNAYVRLGNRQSLDDLLVHRRRIAADMAGRTDFDFSLPLEQLTDEIRTILVGLAKLQPDGQAASETRGAGQAEPSE